jgi:hypothetical protein
MSRYRIQLIASTMRSLTTIVFEINGRAPGGVNLWLRDLSERAVMSGEGVAARAASKNL